MKKSVLKIIAMSLFIAVALNVGRVPETDSFFSATSGLGNTGFSAGWWVTPSISFEDFDGDNAWQVGEEKKLSWKIKLSDPEAKVTDLKLEYACGAGEYKKIEEFSNDPGHYDWTVPAEISNDCHVRIEATDSHNLQGQRESEKFAITWRVVLNEFMPNPAQCWKKDMCPEGNGNKWVELYNNGEEEVDVKDWKIKHSSSKGNSFKISKDNTNKHETKIGPHGFLLVYLIGCDLNEDKDTLELSDGENDLLDWYEYSDASPGRSFAREKDGTGDWTQPVPTPGEKNTKDEEKKEFKKYYTEVCFGEGDEKKCSIKFLESMDIWKNADDVESLVSQIDEKTDSGISSDASQLGEEEENKDEVSAEVSAEKDIVSSDAPAEPVVTPDSPLGVPTE